MTGIACVGSINQDFVLEVERRPAPGETLTGASLALLPGGKGANQAVAAALAGAEVNMVGAVGDDSFGPALVAGLRSAGVGVEHVLVLDDGTTGSAFITVTPDGENSIIVAPGANARLAPELFASSEEAVRNCEVLVVQMEIPSATVERAVSVAEESGARVVLNMAPSHPLPSATLALADPLVVNEHEAAWLLDRRIGDLQAAADVADELCSRGIRSAVVTLGAQGAIAADGSETWHTPAPSVSVVDTTGAGDAFVGALAAELLRDRPLEAAVDFAVRAGAAAVTKSGAQASLPSRSDIAQP